MKAKFLLFSLFLICSQIGLFAQYGNDNASDVTYDDGWSTADNGGEGFSTWNLTTGAGGNVFIASAAGNSDCDILESDDAWGLWANPSNLTEAVRPFSSSLNIGDVLILQMDNGFINMGSSTGFSLRNSSNQLIFEFYFNGGQANYKVNDNAGERDFTGLGWTNTGVEIRFSLTSTSTYSIDVRPLSGTSSYSMTGTIKNPGTQTIDEIRFFCSDNVASDNVYFNNLRVFKPLGNALYFDGSDDYVLIDEVNAFDINTGTIEAWINTSDAGSSFRGIVVKQQAWGLFLADNILVTYDWSGAGTTSTGINLADSKWHHVALSFQSGVVNGSCIYVDGQLVKTFTLNISNHNEELVFGAGSDAGSQHFAGLTDEVRVWNDVRTQTEIQNNMYNYLSGGEVNLVANYRFDQGNASLDNTSLVNEVIDYTGNCNEGTLTNFTLNGATSNWVYPGNSESPIISTNEATSIDGTTVDLNGEIFSVGESDVTTRGFCYSTSDCPTIDDNLVNETGTYTAGAYSLQATGLFTITTYYYRSYAVNSKGTSYGETQSFTTLMLPPYCTHGGPYVIEEDQDLALNGTAGHIDPNRAIMTRVYIINGDSFMGATDMTIPYSSISGFPLGVPLSLKLEVVDDLGQTCTCETTLTIYPKNPVAQGNSAPNSSEYGQEVTFNGSASYHPNPARAIMQYAWDVDGVAGFEGGGSVFQHTYYALGTYDIVLRVTDDLGRTDTHTFEHIVIDDTDPTITCVSDQVVDADATHFYSVQGTEFDPVSTDDNSIIVSVINDFNNSSTLDGAQIPEGTTQIIWTVTDLGGNENSCSFEVKVNQSVPFGNALDFDAIDDLILVNHNANLNMTTELTIEFWFKRDGLTSTGSIIDKTETGDFAHYRVYYLASGEIGLWNGTSAYSTGAGVVVSGEWVHIAIVVNGASSTFYKNGVVCGSSTIGLGAQNAGLLRIGDDIIGGREISGELDEIRIWNTARSDSEIQADMYDYITPVHSQWTNLVAYYCFDQGDASNDNTGLVNEVIDYSGNCNKGVLTNFALSGATSNWIYSGNLEAPISTTLVATLIEGATADLNGEIFSIGESDVTTRGFCYSTSDCPTIDDNLVNETGTYAAGLYSLTASGLFHSTTYYYRSYATNTQGTSYGEVQSFTTTAYTPLGNALDFDGTNDYVSIPHSVSQVSESWTIETWVNAQSNSTDIWGKSITSKASSGVGFYRNIVIKDGKFQCLYTNSGLNYFLLSTTPVVLGTWYHIAVSFDGSLMKIYINGVQEGSVACPALNTMTNVFDIGGRNNQVSEYFDGQIDEVRIWNTARTVGEISINMYDYLAGNEPDLIAYYRFDQGNAGADNTTLINEAIDYSGNCNKGTLSNFALNGVSSNWVYPGNNEAPIVTTNTATLVVATTADLNGEVFSIGETDVTTRGFCYSTIDCPTISDNVVNETGTYGAEAFYLEAIGLLPLTTYYYRSYATNTQGTSYGEVQSFTTTAFVSLGNAFDFDGIDDYVSTTVDADKDVMPTTTWEAWVNPQAPVAGHGMIMCMEDGGWDRFLAISGGNFVVGMSINQWDVAPVTYSKWTHVALIYKPGSMICYIDGVKYENLTDEGAHSSAVNFAIGANDGGLFNWYKGQIDEVRVWNDERTETEIQDNMYNYLAGNETGLVAYYPFDQGDAGQDNTGLVNEVIDYTGNCYKGTLTNTTLNGATSNWVYSGNVEAPIVTTNVATSVDATTADLNGDIFSIGETDVTIRGVCYSTSDCPTISDDFINETGTYTAGSFSLTLTGLFHNTTYYYRAYAINTKGTSYGEVQSFTTTAFAPLGNALYFDATDDLILVNHNANLNMTTELTLEFWFKRDGLTATGSILDKTETGDFAHYRVYYLASGEIGLWNGTSAYSTGAGVIVSGEWVHIAIVVNGASSTFYKNGVVCGSSAIGLGAQNAGLLRIGDDIIGGRDISGELDEIRIWNTARSNSEIQADMYSYITPAHSQWTNLVAYYRFDQGDASNDNTGLVNEVIDYSGNCNKGTLTDFALSGATSNWVYPGNNEAPIITTNSNCIETTSALLSAEIFSIGETDVTTRGFCYSTSDCPTIDDDIVSETGTYSAGVYSLSATSLTAGTMYYYRAYATNTKGTNYGEVQSFSTLSNTQEPGPGYALDFDGTNYVEVPYSAANNSTNFTVECWARVDGGAGTYRSPITSRDVAISNGYMFYANDTDLWSFWGGDGLGAWITLDGPAVVIGEWVHLAGTYDGTTYRFYVNGILVNSIADAFSPNATKPLRIGSGQTEAAANFLFDGVVDEVRIWSDDLTESEIRDWMCRKITASHPKYCTLGSYYRLDESSGATAYDYTGSDNGTLINTPVQLLSSASLGDDSNYDYTAGTPAASIISSYGDGITATVTQGNPDAIHVYRVDEDPNSITDLEGYGNNDHYFGVFQVGGSFPRYSLVYDYEGHQGYTEPDPIFEPIMRLYYRTDNGIGAWTECGVLPDTDANTLTTTGNSTEYSLGTTGKWLLPVEVLEFNALINNMDEVDLNWITSSEKNNDYFTIQRSVNGRVWGDIGEIDGAGNSNSKIHYMATDVNPYNGTSYYRLAQTDFDGTVTYTDIVKVELNSRDEFTIYPNPARDLITIKFDNETDNSKNSVVEIISVLGETLIVKKLQGNTITIGISELKTGVYYLRIGNIVKRFVKE